MIKPNSELARRLVQLIGVEETQQLIHSHGSKRVYIAKNQDACVNALSITTITARQLVRHYGGESITIPLETDWHMWWLAQHGWSLNKIAHFLRRNKSTIKARLRKGS